MAHFKNYLILVALVIFNAYIYNNISAEAQQCNEVVHKYFKYLQSFNKYDDKILKPSVWCDKKAQHCNGILLNNELIKAHPDNQFKALWKNVNELPISYFEDNDSLHEVVHRYFKYLQSFNKYDDKILKPSVWCDKIKFLCLEPLRMAGFISDTYLTTEKKTLAFSANINKAIEINTAGIPSGTIGDYVHYVLTNKSDAYKSSLSTVVWCTKKCTDNMEAHGFGTDVHLSLKRMIKKLKKDEIENYTGCARAITQYYFYESKTNSNCFKCNEDIPSTISYWCTYQCV